MDFGGGGGGLISAGGTDIFIAKYTSAGAHVYSKRIGSTLDDVAMGVSLDGSGNPVIVGYYNGTVDFGDDSGDYAKDGECDDLRFKGSGMTNTGLIAADIMHDASDCRAAFKAGKIKVHYN